MQKNTYVYFIGLATELAVLIVSFLYLGRWVDEKMGWSGFGVAGGSVIALALWITHLVSAMNKAAKLQEEIDREEAKKATTNRNPNP